MGLSPVIDEEERDGQFRAALTRHDFAAARAHCEDLLADPKTERWIVTSMLEDLGLKLGHAERFDESIATFERAIELGWDVVPDGRCEIARVLLLAARHAEADALWRELRAADPEGVWTLNAGGLAYGEVDRHEEALDWLTAALRLELDRGDAERIVDQLSDARRRALDALGRERDALDDQMESFRRLRAEREEARVTKLRVAARRAGLPVRARPVTVAWVGPLDHDTARERWPTSPDGLRDDGPFAELAARMERHLRGRRADGDGPIAIVALDLDEYQAWCDAEDYDPADGRSRDRYATAMADAGRGQRWPPGRNEPCWCGSARKYKRCCGGLV